MSKIVLNAHNLTPKENAVLNGIFSGVKYKMELGITAQGIANLLVGRVGGSVQSTRKALKVLKHMGYVENFHIGKTSFWCLTDLGAAYVYEMKEYVLRGSIARKPIAMFDNEIPF